MYNSDVFIFNNSRWSLLVYFAYFVYLNSCRYDRIGSSTGLGKGQLGVKLVSWDLCFYWMVGLVLFVSSPSVGLVKIRD